MDAIERAEHGMVGLLTPVAAIEHILEAEAQMTAVIEKCLKEGTDYGIVPGTGKKNKTTGAVTDAKRSLFKAGAERLNKAFGIVAKYYIVEKEIDHNFEYTYTKEKWNNAYDGDKSRSLVEGKAVGLYRYVYDCHLFLGERLIGTGQGACSTLESKFCDRPRDCENTVVKMAQKRSLIAAALNAYALSDRFTQDLEDFADASSEELAGMTVQQKVDYASRFLSEKCKFTGTAVKGFCAFCGRSNASWTEIVIAWINEKGGEVATSGSLIAFAKEYFQRPAREEVADPSAIVVEGKDVSGAAEQEVAAASAE